MLAISILSSKESVETHVRSIKKLAEDRQKRIQALINEIIPDAQYQ